MNTGVQGPVRSSFPEFHIKNPSSAEGGKDGRGGEKFGQSDRFGGARFIDEIERHGAAAEAREFGGDRRIVVGPVTFEGDDGAVMEEALHFIGAEDEVFVGLTGGAPAGGEIDVHRFSGLLRGGHSGGAPLFPDNIVGGRSMWPTEPGA